MAFFPTSYLHQITLPPFAEYLMLHNYVLAGGGDVVNIVPFASFAACLAGVCGIARALGATGRGQWMAAIFCATLPGAILQASGAKNYLVLALWLVCPVYFGLRGSAFLCGSSVSLAVAAKATAYLFIPPLALFLFCMQWTREKRLRAAPLFAAILGGVLLLNAPQYRRNIELTGSPLGYGSAFENGSYPHRNRHPGWRAAASNLLRHFSEQLGGHNARWN